MQLDICLQPKQKLFLRAVEQYPYVFYGGARGGGKSKGIQLVMLIRRFKYPGTSGAIFRKSFPELDGNHIRPLLTSYPNLRQYWHESKKLLSLPNGSTLQFCHCSTDDDVHLYQGREFGDLAIDEVGQWQESTFRTLLGSNRSSVPGFKPRCILTGNPGGIGHSWLKRLFIERNFNERERPEDYHFIQALVGDNQALALYDPEYVNRLLSEPNEALRKAYLYGSWEIQAGQFFTEISRDVHLIKPFNIPAHWTKFGAYDYGYSHPAAFGWFACDEDGNVYLYREFVKAGLRIDQFANELLKFPDTAKLDTIVAGHDAFAKRGAFNAGSAPSVSEEFSRHGIYMEHAKIDRVQGAAQLRNYLAWQNLSDGRKLPRFFIFNNCTITFNALSAAQHDPDRVEDVLKVDASYGDPMTGDDAYDMARYGLMSRPILAEPIREINKDIQSIWEPAHIDRLIKIGQDEEKKKMGIETIDEPEAMDGWDDYFNQGF